MTEQDARNFISNMYFKYFETENNTGSYSDDVVYILNKVTNSKIYQVGFNINGWVILKDKVNILVGDIIGVSNFLKNEILLFKLNLLD